MPLSSLPLRGLGEIGAEADAQKSSPALSAGQLAAQEAAILRLQSTLQKLQQSLPAV
eukprot:m.154327 g.154327  ORF g.154327 m.154327 type:complete len:57 (+) comp52883_c0_seq1:2029-2199(+)